MGMKSNRLGPAYCCDRYWSLSDGSAGPSLLVWIVRAAGFVAVAHGPQPCHGHDVRLGAAGLARTAWSIGTKVVLLIALGDNRGGCVFAIRRAARGRNGSALYADPSISAADACRLSQPLSRL